MEFRKMVTITLCTRQQKRHWCIEQSYGHCGRGRGWDDLGEWHWNMYNIIYETSCHFRFNARYWMLGACALGWPRGMVWGGRKEEGSGWATRVCLWQIHFDIWQNQYNIVKFKKKIKLKKKKKDCMSHGNLQKCGGTVTPRGSWSTWESYTYRYIQSPHSLSHCVPGTMVNDFIHISFKNAHIFINKGQHNKKKKKKKGRSMKCDTKNC